MDLKIQAILLLLALVTCIVAGADYKVGNKGKKIPRTSNKFAKLKQESFDQTIHEIEDEIKTVNSEIETVRKDIYIKNEHNTNGTTIEEEERAYQEVMHVMEMLGQIRMDLQKVSGKYFEVRSVSGSRQHCCRYNLFQLE